MLALLAVVTLALAGCGGGDMAELDNYIQEVYSHKDIKIDPLPEIKPYETYSYQSAEKRDPFQSTFSIAEPTAAGTGPGPRPDPNRRKEALEAFPLDTVRMVGLLEQGNEIWAIIEASDRTIHRVKTGNYIGQNHGRIISIAEDKIDLIEIVPNGLGGWEERPASIALSEVE